MSRNQRQGSSSARLRAQDECVSERMAVKVFTLKPDEHLLDALLLTCSSDIRHIPIAVDGKLVGLISDRDIKRALPASSEGATEVVWAKLEELKISDIMTRSVRTIDPNATLRDAAAILMQNKISALPVVDGELRIEGIITTEDILWAFVEDEGED